MRNAMDKTEPIGYEECMDRGGEKLEDSTYRTSSLRVEVTVISQDTPPHILPQVIW